MKRTLLTVLLVLMLSVAASAAKAPEVILANSTAILREIASQPDAEPLQGLLKNAYGVAIFPSVIKIGFGLGGRYGEGVLLQYDPDRQIWYGPYFVNLKGLSYGAQIGFQSTALVLVITNERGIESLKEGKITLGGSLSVAAGPLGRSAEAGTNIHLEASIYSYSMSKGIFAGASLEGAVIDGTESANRQYWQEKLTPHRALARRASGGVIEPLLKELRAISN